MSILDTIRTMFDFKLFKSTEGSYTAPNKHEIELGGYGKKGRLGKSITHRDLYHRLKGSTVEYFYQAEHLDGRDAVFIITNRDVFCITCDTASRYAVIDEITPIDPSNVTLKNDIEGHRVPAIGNPVEYKVHVNLINSTCVEELTIKLFTEEEGGIFRANTGELRVSFRGAIGDVLPTIYCLTDYFKK